LHYSKLNREIIHNEILTSCFSKKEIFEIKKKFFNGNTKNSDSDAFINSGMDIRRTIDTLITFSEINLPKDRFLKMLLKMGDLVAASGEFSAALDINEKIIYESKNINGLEKFYASALYSAADIYSRQAQWKLSFVNINKALSVFKKIGDLTNCAKCENLLGTIFGEKSDLVKAKYHLEKSLNYLKEKGDDPIKGMTKINLGVIHTIQGNFDSAFSFYKKAFSNFKRTGDKRRLAEIKYNIGMVYIKKREFKSAITEFDYCIRLTQKESNVSILGLAYLSKAYAYSQVKDFNLSEINSKKAMEIFCKTNDRLSIAEIYKIRGIVEKNLGNFKVSENYLLTSLRINKELANELNFAETSYELGLLYKENNMVKESKLHFNTALKYFKKIKAHHEVKSIELAFI
jgi:tetratricopeptide (TPR) repeat protein